MIGFWDTSAILPIIFQEPHTPRALLASRQTVQSYAWRWLRVEAEAALVRRRGSPQDFGRLRTLLASLSWIDLAPHQYDKLCAFNQRHALRAADAGHLFCFKQLSVAFPEARLICFDQDVVSAAQRAGLRLWTPS